ncbi:unnamed protein product [Acanthoscelides obtectus]|uniref:Uncharacterized protein n=1 Tax=Acanthoscelides obtectus TaxID=200917 RepID=A0A9P0VUP8_ACAOB|nr:unnamed protein product [Acanthoscelides obtectus]CAK1684757.1 hypothetical protein AOBTE_LOCUS35093 [Acanthoscelides obtectus]
MAGTGVPPINIEGTADWSSLSRMMNSKGIQFSKARTAGTSVKVFTNTPADYRQLVALLESIKRPFFTYQLKEDRMDQRVIRGLRERCQSMTSKRIGEPRHRRRPWFSS